MWLTSRTQCHCAGLPALTDQGTWTTGACDMQTQPPTCLPVGLGTEAADTKPKHTLRSLPLRILQYNVLSLKGLTARALLAAGLRRCCIDIAGFQETREQRSGFSSFEGWWVLSASSTTEGVGGAQIWINPSNPALTWDRRALSILHSTPQCLIVAARVNNVDVALVSAHAPPAVSPAHVLQMWWSELEAAIRVVPRKYSLMVCVDANAHFHQDPAYPETVASAPICRNAGHLLDFVQHVEGDLSAQFDSDGRRLVSWSPSDHEALIDYVLYPRAWRAAAVTRPSPDLRDLHAGRDHRPILLELDARLDCGKPTPQLRVDCASLATPAGLLVARQALASVPTVPWNVDSTAHVDVIHRHLHACLKERPPPPTRARNPALTDETIQLVLYKRHMQRCLTTMKRRTRQLLLWTIFKAWRRP